MTPTRNKNHLALDGKGTSAFFFITEDPRLIPFVIFSTPNPLIQHSAVEYQ